MGRLSRTSHRTTRGAGWPLYPGDFYRRAAFRSRYRSLTVRVIRRLFASGQVIADRFEIVSYQGRGGMGEVYKGRDRTLQRIVALKVLRQHVAQQPGQLYRFEQEALPSP